MNAGDGIREWDINLCWDVESLIFTESFPQVTSLLAPFSFFFSGENVNSELPVLDVCDISTTDIGESFVLQEHVQSAFFWEADEYKCSVDFTTAAISHLA